MAVTGTMPQLQCDHDQLVCPLQNITCQCVGTPGISTIFWSLDSQLIAWVTDDEEILGNDANYPVTIMVLKSGLLASNLGLSFVAGPATVQCQNVHGISYWSYFIVGKLL